MSRIDPEKTLLVMALKEESQGLFESQGIPVFYTGVGLISSTHQLTKRLLQDRPQRVLNLGSAGSRRFQKGSLVEVEKTLRRDSVMAWLNKAITLDLITDLPRGVCASADFVDTSLNTEKWDLMDMEVFALASVCQSFGVPLTSIKYVTDSSDHQVAQDWEKNLKVCAENLLSFFLKVTGT